MSQSSDQSHKTMVEKFAEAVIGRQVNKLDNFLETDVQKITNSKAVYKNLQEAQDYYSKENAAQWKILEILDDDTKGNTTHTRVSHDNKIYKTSYTFGSLALSLQNGTTVAGSGTGAAGSTNNALNIPWGLALGADGSLFVSDYHNCRVMKLQEGSLMGSIVAGTGVAGTTNSQLNTPAELHVDASSNLYINDNYAFRVMLWRKNSSTGVRVAGNGSSGNTLSTFGSTIGLAMDSLGNIYVSDMGNHRVMKWSPNASSATVVAGTGGAGNSSHQLNSPYDLYLDELNSYLYIADLNNNRIQQYWLGNSTNGTTVAGGHGPGSNANQLNAPYSVCFEEDRRYIRRRREQSTSTALEPWSDIWGDHRWH